MTGGPRIRDERPALAGVALIAAGLATFLLALALLGGDAAAEAGDEALWVHAMPQPGGSEVEAPAGVATVDGVVVIADAEDLRVLETDGSLRWSVAVEAQGWWSDWRGPHSGAIAAAGRIVVSSHDGIAVRDLSTGDERWRVQAVGVGGTVVDDDRVYAVLQTETGGSVLVAHDLATGARSWEVALDDESWATTLTLTTAGLAVSTSRWEEDDDGRAVDGTTTVSVLDPETGTARWQDEVAGAAQVLADPGDGPLVVVAEEGGLVGLDPATGGERWRSAVRGFPLLVTDGAVALLELPDSGIEGHEPTSALIVVDAATGGERWRSDPAYTIVADVADGRVALASVESPYGRPGSDHDVRLRVLDLATGATTSDVERSYTVGTPWRPLGLALDDTTLHVTRDDGVVEALDPVTLEPRWSVSPVRPTTRDLTPVATGDDVHLIGADGAARSIALTDGTERWARLHGLQGGSPPTASEDAVYAVTGLGVVRAYDVETGDIRWETDRRHAASDVSLPRPVVVGPTLVAVDADGTLLGLDTATGTERWTLPREAPPPVGLTVSGSDLVVADADGRVWALDPDSGRPRWTATVGSPVRSGPVAAGPVVAVVTTDGQVVALDAGTGAPAWSRDTGAAEPSALARDATSLYVRLDGAVTALDAASGRIRWTTEEAFRGGLAVARGQVVVAAGDLAVAVLSTETGEEADRIDVDAPVLAVTAAPDGSVLVLTTGPELRRYR